MTFPQRKGPSGRPTVGGILKGVWRATTESAEMNFEPAVGFWLLPKNTALDDLLVQLPLEFELGDSIEISWDVRAQYAGTPNTAARLYDQVFPAFDFGNGWGRQDARTGIFVQGTVTYSAITGLGLHYASGRLIVTPDEFTSAPLVGLAMTLSESGTDTDPVFTIGDGSGFNVRWYGEGASGITPNTNAFVPIAPPLVP